MAELKRKWDQLGETSRRKSVTLVWKKGAVSRKRKEKFVDALMRLATS